MAVTFAQIEEAALSFSTARRKLSDFVGDLETQMAELKRKAIKPIRDNVDATAEKQSLLYNLLKEAKDLFVSPRTVVLHGIKVGYQKGKGRVEYNDAAMVVERVRKHLPKEFDDLIETKYVPNADALAKLDASTLRKLGVNIVDADDQIVLKPTDSAVDKVVNALLKDASLNEKSGS
jgi:hypothetical protein